MADDTALNALAQRTVEELAPQLARVTVQCGECEVEADGVLSGSVKGG